MTITNLCWYESYLPEKLILKWELILSQFFLNEYMDIMQLLNTDTLWNPQKNLRIYVKE